MATLDSDSKKKPLGRGLASLIPEATANEGSIPALTQKKDFFYCDIEKIVPNTYQPRKIFEKNALDELVESVKVHGIIQPLVVRKKDGSFELIAGERRWRAAQKAGLKQVPVLVKEVPEDQISLEMALIENVMRADLNCIEEAIAYQQLVDEFQLSQEDISARVGKNRATIANTLRLLKLPAAIREDITAGNMTMGHARALLALDSPQDQLEIREMIIKKKLSVRETERQVNDLVRTKNKASASKEKVENVHLSALENDLRRIFGTMVKIAGSEQKGTIQFTYATRDDLMLLADKLKGMEHNVSQVIPAASNNPSDATQGGERDW